MDFPLGYAVESNAGIIPRCADRPCGGSLGSPNGISSVHHTGGYPENLIDTG
ncbi:MAG: hypothetical protein ABIW48_04730 [Burkholderiales bacterium]